MMEIRNATLEEVEKVTDLWLEFIKNPKGSDLNIVPNEENKERWKEFAEGIIKKKLGAVKIAIVDGNIVGYILYTYRDSPLQLYKKRGTIYDLFVREKYRGMGIGKALLSSALEDLKLNGVKMVQLYVKSDNITAISLYESYGFKESLKVMRREF